MPESPTPADLAAEAVRAVNRLMNGRSPGKALEAGRIAHKAIEGLLAAATREPEGKMDAVASYASGVAEGMQLVGYVGSQGEILASTHCTGAPLKQGTKVYVLAAASAASDRDSSVPSPSAVLDDIRVLCSGFVNERTAPGIVKAIRDLLAAPHPSAQPTTADWYRRNTASVDFLPHDDILRFAARVLDSEHPTEEDRNRAASELRQLRQSIRPSAQPAMTLLESHLDYTHQVLGTAQPAEPETLCLARVAVAECPAGEPMLTDWMDCAMKVCRALAAQPAEPKERKPLDKQQRRRIIYDCYTIGEAIDEVERAHGIQEQPKESKE